MKIVHISGSRNREGKTASMTKAFVEAAVARGATVDETFLPELNIERCRQCDANGWGLCRKSDEGKCVIEDDFASVFDKMKEADGILMSTPVYYGSLSESLRAFTDRLRRVAAGRPFVKGKPVIMVAVAGGGGGGAPSCIEHMNKLVENCGMFAADFFPVRRQTMKAKPAQLARAAESLVAGEYGDSA